jgi:hypothetical protein
MPVQVQSWLGQQVDASVRRIGGNRNRKRPAEQAESETNPRSRPRPRLQDTHKLSDQQKLNLSPSTERKTLIEVCHKYNLDYQQLFHEVKRCLHLTSLPIVIDEYTRIDTWHSLRVHLHSDTPSSKAKMQRIRSKPPLGNEAAKHDPVFYIASEDIAAPTAKLHSK